MFHRHYHIVKQLLDAWDRFESVKHETSGELVTGQSMKSVIGTVDMYGNLPIELVFWPL